MAVATTAATGGHGTWGFEHGVCDRHVGTPAACPNQPARMVHSNHISSKNIESTVKRSEEVYMSSSSVGGCVKIWAYRRISLALIEHSRSTGALLERAKRGHEVPSKRTISLQGGQGSQWHHVHVLRAPFILALL